VCPSARHPATVLEEGGQGGIAEGVRPGTILETVETAEAFGLEQTGYHLDLYQIVGQLVEM
jgi:hypothetical protein